MNKVLTPAAWAWATIEATLPPSEWLMYQIHIPWPSNTLGSLGAGSGFGFGGPIAWAYT